MKAIHKKSGKTYSVISESWMVDEKEYVSCRQLTPEGEIGGPRNIRVDALTMIPKGRHDIG